MKVEYYGYWKEKSNRTKHAKECLTRMDFKNKYSRGYKACSKEELEEYFGSRLSFDKRYIYKFTFPDNSIYIGLTCNISIRKNCHLKIKGAVFDYINKTNTNPLFEIMTLDSIKESDIGELESFIISEYKSSNKNILNTSTGGELGSGIRKWTIENIEEEIKKFPTRNKLKHGNNTVYNKIRKLNLINKYYQ